MSKVIKLFPPLIEAIEKALVEIFVENRKADKAISGILKSNPKWGSRDRGFIAENTYDMVRNWRLINYCYGEDDVSNKLTGTYRELIGIWLIFKGYDLSSSTLFGKIDIEKINERRLEADKDRRIKFSVADWMDEKISEEIGEAWPAELEALSNQAEVFLRVNTTKISKEDLIKLLQEKDVEVSEVEGVESALLLKKRMNVFSLEEFKKGFFEVQDAGSQMISELLDIQPEQRVIDACAGAGGKTLHMANIMKNKGRIIALDVEEHKLVELKSRAKRNGLSNIEPKLIESKTIKRLRDTADRLLLDVPCSGLGVLKRNPDAKWKLKPEFLDEIKQVQATILQDYSKILKSGGKMVYATCSILPSENEKQVEKFLANNPDYFLIKEKKVSPAQTGFDGFYMALIGKA
ncbi:RsmB/NOP family class I SAM-dependent RNA methyltransferase [Lacihabitans sp. CS3-21]|uniref:RsmB/NOP family class I SAM-dependent RNA methyltransferase n=1 Tax=Lacihabitans sp. CS3-21 TaxID=2487332 RepID=UPI0020CCF0C7|nr:RsmB/NOP family class I SAM-dependent RNA methyltransferase [Lacihabitans sp. CS3-21]MCP9746894.1 RsmB/NOP family class I SAM-dependent RNA methyltransferase [Lacihabitans sp. CS3-21]